MAVFEHKFDFSIRDINKNTVDFEDNFDASRKEPKVLPSRFPNILVNGTMGIGIGAASSIPQFNIKEVNNALEKLLLNPDIGFDDIYCAPDFATGALLLNEGEVKQALKNGQGSSCKLRSVVEWDNKEKCFIVTQIPYKCKQN